LVKVLVATSQGCIAVSEAGEREIELPQRPFSALSAERGGSCLAVVERNEIWRRGLDRQWVQLATADINLQSIASSNGFIFAGASEEAAIIRVSAKGGTERLIGFDNCPGRDGWFANGPPLGVRSLAVTGDDSAIVAAVHVGGLPYSSDRGNTWTPTIPILFDVHEVSAHPTMPNLVAAATAVGLCVSDDCGQTWRVISEGLEIKNSLALAVLDDQILLCVADGPFAKQSQILRWQIGSDQFVLLRDGLPEWLDGKVDTAQITTSGDRVAFVDGGGNLWLSAAGATGWTCLASDIPYPVGISTLTA
jgi:hypothetical protein